ncbi:hypothetical protein GXW82_15730 [Streptacidiphilus sp. 4-A2]|nr:hypothetical protein [Streptacidiphilus sp. 4-A2]
MEHTAAEQAAEQAGNARRPRSAARAARAAPGRDPRGRRAALLVAGVALFACLGVWTEIRFATGTSPRRAGPTR